MMKDSGWRRGFIDEASSAMLSLCFYYVVTKDKLICDLKSQFSTIIPIVKVRLRSKVSSSKFYGTPGASSVTCTLHIVKILCKYLYILYIL